MFRMSRAPNATRPLTRGSLRAARFTASILKLLGIVHEDLVAVERLALRWRQDARYCREPEQIGIFDLDQKLQQGLGLLGADVHFEYNLVLGISRRADR